MNEDWVDIPKTAETAESSDWTDIPAVPTAPAMTPQQRYLPSTASGAVSSFLEPITSYPATYSEMNKEAREQVGQGVDQLSKHDSAWDVAKGVGNVALGSLDYVSSPISAGYRTLLGKPVEEITGIPKEFTEFASSLLTPGIGLTRFPRFKTSPLPPATEAEKIVNAAERIGFEIPKAAVAGPTWQTVAGAVKEIPIIGAPIVKSSKKALSDIENAVQETASKYGAIGTEDAGRVAKEAIEGWVSSKGESGRILDRLYDKVDNFVDPLYTRQLDSTADTISKIMAERANAKMSGRSPAVDEVLNAVQSAEGMNYEGLKKLRSYIGKMTPEQMVAKNIDQTEAKRIYAALSDDLKNTILAAGSEEATKMFGYANSVARIISDKRKQLSKIIGTKADAAPEKVISRIESMATGKSSADIQKLRDVKHAIGDGAWNEVAGNILNRMGRTAEDAPFSGDRFVTKFDNMSANARNLLFGSNPELYQSVKDLADVSKSFKSLNKLGNPSGTGRVNAALSTVFGGGAVTGMFVEPVTTIVSLITSLAPSIGVAKYMASPAKVKQASAFGKAYNNAMFNPTAANLVVFDTASRAFNKTLEDTQEDQPRATGGSVFDKMHMARKRAEGGGTDAPFNEWDAVPRNAEGIPQIRIQKPPVNEADEAQAAREAAHDPNNIGMSEADYGGFASTGKKLSEGIIPKMFDAIVGEPSRQMKSSGYPAGSEEDDFLNAGNRRDAMYWAPDMALNMAGVGGPLAMTNAGKNAIGIAGGRGVKSALANAALEQPQGIRAYHGSPHDFDKFDLAKIGTGEGAQSYGHGLYFAENPATAQAYRETLGKQAGGPEVMAQDWIRDWGDQAVAKLEARIANSPSSQTQWYNDIKTAVQNNQKPGRMYEVNINAKPEQFLDWDKPLAGQSDKLGPVKDVWNNVRGTTPEWGHYFPWESQTGRDAYTLLSSKAPRDQITAGLQDAGIPGIKYLDQGSRGTSGGTSNYVVFDPNIIEIMKKYGMTLPAATAAYEAMKSNQEKTGFKKGGSVFDKMKRASK